MFIGVSEVFIATIFRVHSTFKVEAVGNSLQDYTAPHPTLSVP
jgi:hypothetical protein